MATILYFSTHGSADPTEASMPFHMAVGALEAGHQPQIVLAGEATYLIKTTIADQVYGVGIPPLKELLQKIIRNQVPIAI